MKRKIIEINDELCDGCGNCILACAEGAIEISDGKAKVVKDMLCDGLGACIGECPSGALSIVEREADVFDEEAVLKHLATKKSLFSTSCQAANNPKEFSTAKSPISNWPVKIELVPATSPFLNKADLLIAADCTSISTSSFHKDFCKNRKVIIGCPKFGNIDAYIEKFSEIFGIANIKSITLVIMEVPCCSALFTAVKKAMELSEKIIPFENIVLRIGI